MSGRSLNIAFDGAIAAWPDSRVAVELKSKRINSVEVLAVEA